MRVCMIVRNPAVRDPRVLKEARALAEAGHELTLIGTAEPGVPDAEERDGFRITRIEPVPSWVRRLARRPAIPAQATEAAPSAPARTAPARRPQFQAAVRDWIVSRRLTAAALKQPADVYHAHDLNTLMAGWRAARRHGARLVYDAHELYPELAGLGPRERARWDRLERYLIARPDAVIVPSASRADEFAQRYGIRRPKVVMNCPTASAQPDPAASPLAGYRRPGEALLVYAGGFNANRGLENLVRAAGMIVGARLVMIGFGSLEGELRRLAGPEGDRVAFHPPVEHDAVVALVAGADVGLAPYLPVGLNNVLAAPNKLFEYLHAGIAIAGSDLPDIRGVVERHRVGAVFDAADPSSIADAVTELIASPDELAAMKRRAREASSLYTWDAQVEVLLGIYEQLGAATPR
jgi:glycosyltransferase involved in cell wall biosynthesis